MKFAILIPAYRDMKIPVVNSLLKLVMTIASKEHACDVGIVEGFNIAKQRNKIFDILDDMDFDYYIALDTDMVFEPNQVFDLIDKIEKEDLPMLSGMYKVRSFKQNELAMIDEIDGKLQKIPYDKEMKGIQVCKTIGLGFCVMKSEFVKYMYSFTNKHPFDMDGKRGIGEDGYFCQRVREAGYPVCFDADTAVGHLATVIRR